MKTAKSIIELAQEIERQSTAKRDFIASSTALGVENLDGEVKLTIPNLPALRINSLAHSQIADHLCIPKKYYDVMLAEAPSLLVQNINHWLQSNTDKRMVRTLDGKVRAFLSDRYRPLDYNDLLTAALPPLIAAGVEILSCEVTERRLYIKAVDKRITRDIPSGKKMGDGSHVFFDTVSPAIVISNSEVGFGMLSVETAVWTTLCTNLAIAAQRSLRKYHVGGRQTLGEGMFELLSDKTKRITDAALWAQVGDIVKNAFEQAKFDATVNEIRGMVEQKIVGDVPAVVEMAAKHFSLTDGERKSVLTHLIEGGDLTRYGLFNAITRTAEDLPDYDRATDFERLGGQVIELPANDWKRIAEAA